MLSWRDAMEVGLYGPEGFFIRQAPSRHFRTSVTASPLTATALAEVARRVDATLGHPEVFTITDVGAGRGELLHGLAAALPGTLRPRARFVAVERAPRPAGLPAWIEWLDRPPAGTTGLLLAVEWLDNVPLDVAEIDERGERRLVEVDPRTGGERLAGRPSTRDAAWLDRWWPAGGAPQPGERAEIGHPRDDTWASAVADIDRGLALAVDYGHLVPARPPTGTLTGFRDGRQVAPVPDGSCDVTAHVAMDAVAAAGEEVAGHRAVLIGQRRALHALGVRGIRPPLQLATTDPAGYVRALASATQAAELTDPSGLGGHWWLVQPVGATIDFGLS